MAKCRVFRIDHNLKEVVPEGLYMKHLFGQTVSVAVVKFLEDKGHDLPAKPHSHGEEASVQLVGGCWIIEGEGNDGDPEVALDQGDAVIIPANLAHYGRNRFASAGVSLRLNVVTPPRKEYGAEDTVPYYPLRGREER